MRSVAVVSVYIGMSVLSVCRGFGIPFVGAFLSLISVGVFGSRIFAAAVVIVFVIFFIARRIVVNVIILIV